MNFTAATEHNVYVCVCVRKLVNLPHNLDIRPR